MVLPTQAPKRVNPDEYVDLAFRSIMDFNASVTKAERLTIDLDKFKDFFNILISQAESICIGAGYIERTKKKLNMDSLSPTEKELYEAAKKFFAEQVPQNKMAAANTEKLARRLLAIPIEGRYDAKIKEKKIELELDKEIKDNELRRTRQYLLDNYRFQLMLEAVSAERAHRKEMSF